jgi:hypothetical protein
MNDDDMTEEEFDQAFAEGIPMLPVAVDEVTLAFPADLSELLPPWEEIPDEFKKTYGAWVAFADLWFGQGLAATTEFYCKDGIDGATAVRHLKAILGSFQPKHEHKIAGVAYLCSLWFEKVEKYDPGAGQPITGA